MTLKPAAVLLIAFIVVLCSDPSPAQNGFSPEYNRYLDNHAREDEMMFLEERQRRMEVEQRRRLDEMQRRLDRMDQDQLYTAPRLYDTPPDRSRY